MKAGKTPWTIARLPTSKADGITNAIVYYLVDDMRPFSTVESSSFRFVNCFVTYSKGVKYASFI